MSTPETGVRTNLSALRQQAETPAANVQVGFTSSAGFELMQRGAKLLASSSLVPKDYQGNLPNCVIALNMASRLGADPLLIMQNLYVVHGRPSWSAQFLIACFNQCGRFSAMRYRWGGTEGKDDWSCQAYAKELDGGEVITGPVITIALAKKEGWYAKSGSKWQTIPQLMLMYRAAAWLVRTHAPELSMGLQTREEMHDVYDTERLADGRFTVSGVDDLRIGSASITAAADPKVWTDTLNGQTTIADLEKTWQACLEAFNSSPPNDCDSAYQNRREALIEKDGKQLDL